MGVKCSRKSKVRCIEKEEDVDTRFRAKRVNFELSAPDVNRVALSGDFNSWNENGIPLKRDRNGVWKTAIDLKPGRYEYKFIVDGQWWTDPANNNSITNPLGTENSVKEVNLQ